jgi:hypothetical protein
MDRKIVEFLIIGKTMNVIARELHKGKRKVRKIRDLAEEYGYLERRIPIPAYPEALFPDQPDKRSLKTSDADITLCNHKDWITERLATGWEPITVYRELPVPVSRSSYYRFLIRHNLDQLGEDQRKRVISEIIHDPGESLQVDWGKLRTVKDHITGKKKTIWIFVGVLGFSRYMMVRLVDKLDTETTLSALADMLQEIGGVPLKITSDNPKVFSIKADKYEAIVNPAYERFASHYGAFIECLPPADPQKKGKVERQMSFVRRLFKPYGEKWEGLKNAQEFMDRKIALANERNHGTLREKPIDRFLHIEADSLKKLPILAYEIEQFNQTGVRQDGHVRFKNKYYSVDEKYIGKEVIVIGNSKSVVIYHEGKLIEVHEIVSDRNQTKSTKKHHLKPWERAMDDNSVYRKRAQRLGPHVDKMITHFLFSGLGFVDTRKVWGILSLDKTYYPEDIDEACRQAMQMGSYGYQAVKRLLELGLTSRNYLKNKEISAAEIISDDKENKFIRSLSEYKERMGIITTNKEGEKSDESSNCEGPTNFAEAVHGSYRN